MRFQFLFDAWSKVKATWMMLTLGIIIGMFIMGYLRRPESIPAPEPDSAQAGAVLPGGQQLVEVKPPVALLPTIPGLKPGVETVRHIELTVRPDPITPKPDDLPIQPPDVKVMLDLVRLPDGHLRVVAYAEGGRIIESIDIPVASQPITAPTIKMKTREYHWAALAERIIPLNSGLAPAWGAQVLYSHGPFIGGVAANRYEGRIAAGIRW